MTAIRNFEINIDAATLEDLQQRLAATRFPEAETPDDWSQGVPLAYARELVDYWRSDYNWSNRQQLHNRFPQFITQLEDLDIHFIHALSKHADARPLLITHGWPGSVVEFHKVIEPLIDPVNHGGRPEDAFHVVCPSLPGYGFSAKPSSPGWGVEKIAGAWDVLMRRLGYSSYLAQGGDWGSAVTTAIAMQNLGACRGIHLNMVSVRAPERALKKPSERDKKALQGAAYYQQWGAGYSKEQSTRPQTLGYALVDSPVGQAMWIIEKFYEWTDCDGHPENALDRDEMLDNVMFYWLTGSGASSGKLYWESFNRAFGSSADNKVRLPTGATIFPKEIVATPREWAEERFPNIVYWNEVDKGGHFAAFEQPEVFVGELRSCFDLMRD